MHLQISNIIKAQNKRCHPLCWPCCGDAHARPFEFPAFGGGYPSMAQPAPLSAQLSMLQSLAAWWGWLARSTTAAAAAAAVSATPCAARGGRTCSFTIAAVAAIPCIASGGSTGRCTGSSTAAARAAAPSLCRRRGRRWQVYSFLACCACRVRRAGREGRVRRWRGLGGMVLPQSPRYLLVPHGSSTADWSYTGGWHLL